MTPKHATTLLLALSLLTALAGCTGLSVDDPTITLLDGDSPYDMRVRLTNTDEDGRMVASPINFVLVDANKTLHEVDFAYTDFPTLKLGPGESAEGWIGFATAGPGPWSLKYDGTFGQTQIQLPFEA